LSFVAAAAAAFADSSRCALCEAAHRPRLPLPGAVPAEAKETEAKGEAKADPTDTVASLLAFLRKMSGPVPAFADAVPSTIIPSGLGQTNLPPSQALFAARQLAAQGAVPSLSFSLLPEAFLPAVLPPTLATKLAKGDYVDFDEALKPLSSPGSAPSSADASDAKAVDPAAPARTIRMLREWMVVYTTLYVYICDHKPAALRDWAAYLKAFVLLVGRNGFAAAFDYDKQNRSYCARSGAPMAVFKADLWLPPATVTATASSAARPNKRRESFGGQPKAKRERPTALVDGKEVCRLFNIGRCRDPCANGRAHVCSSCHKAHSRSDCKAAAASSTSASSQGKA
jgi:hypothetical protein